MIRKYLLFVMLLCLNSFKVLAQDTKLPVTPGDNDVATSNKETQVANIYNVDPFTGIGSVNIPIYDYSVDGLDLGVSLIYNNKGIKVEDIASSIGLGWDLNLGGYITREVNGIEDEFGFDADTNNSSAPAFNGNWIKKLPGLIEEDKEPDIYTLNLAGRTIKFAIQYPDTVAIYALPRIFTEPKSEISIKFHVYFSGNLQTTTWERPPLEYFGLGGTLPNPMHPRTYIDFTIIDEKGNQFYFERGDWQEVLYDKTPTLMAAQMYSTQKWVLKRVKTYTGAQILYDYQVSSVSYPLYSNEMVRERKAHLGLSAAVDSVISENIWWTGFVSQIKNIHYPNGVTVKFHIDSSDISRCDIPGAHVVDSIEIVSEYEAQCRNSLTYILKHSYYHTPHVNNSSSFLPHHTPCQDITNIGGTNYHWYGIRLSLDSIQRVGRDHVWKEGYYAFTYHSTPLPLRLSHQKDYYGYFNNGTSTPLSGFYLSIPYHSFELSPGNVVSYGADRTSDATSNLDYIQAGLLKKIKNTYNGEIEFFYKKPVLSNPYCSYGDESYNNLRPQYSYVEPNGDCADDPDLMGKNEPDGLVVDRVFLKDGFSNANDLQIRYTYNDGQRFFKGGYFWYLTRVLNGMVERNYTNFFISPHKYYNGSNHGFSNVVVTKENPNTSELLSKTEYDFTNLIMDTGVLDSTSHSLFNGVIPDNGKSLLTVKTGLYYHSSVPDFQQCFLGLVKQVKEYGPSNTLLSTSTNKYSFSPYGLNYYMTSNGTKGVQNFSVYKFYHYDSVNTAFPYNLLPRHVRSVEEAFSYGICQLAKSTVIHTSGSTSLTTEYEYEHDYKHNVKTIKWKDSKGESFRKEFTYTYESGFCNNCLADTVQFKLIDRLVNVTKNKVIHHNISKPVILGHDSLYHNLNTKIIAKVRFPYVFQSTINGGIDYSTATSDESSALSLSSNISSLKRVKEYTKYDYMNNVLETKFLQQENYDCYIWDTRFGEKICEVKNARYDDIAYTSFEGLSLNSTLSDYDKGNWLVEIGAVELDYPWVTTKPITGKYLYNLSTANITTANNLESGRMYLLSFWAPEVVKVYFNSNPGNLLTPNEETLAVNNMKLYTLVVQGDGGQLTIAPPDVSSTGTPYLDELRLHPIEASMTTATYEPLFGISSTCDERNNILRFEYDVMGRQTTVRNTRGEIISHTKHVNHHPNY